MIRILQCVNDMHRAGLETMLMKQRVKQLAITERSVKMKKIVAVVIIMFIFSIIILGEGSKLVFQKICERRETAWPDLGTADDEQYEWLAEAYKMPVAISWKPTTKKI